MADNNNSSAVLNWNSYQNWINGLSGYEIWKKEENGPYVFQEKLDEKTNSLTNFLVSDKNTCFKVRATENNTGFFSWSNEICIDPDLVIPNAISPNGDQINDQWIITTAGEDKAEVSIFNQWNMEVYHADKYKNNWSGNELPDGVYYYHLKLKDRESSGYLLIAR